MFSRYKLIFIPAVIVIVAIILFLLLHPKGPDEDKVVQVYVQLSISQMKFQDNPEKLAAERKKIFSQYKFSQKELNKFIQSCERHPEKWVELWGRINQRLAELIEQEKDHSSK